MSTEEQFNQSVLLDALLSRLGLKTDAALARALDVAPPVLSKVRNNRLPVGATLLIRAHEVSGISIRDLRALMGDRREKFRAAGVGDGRAGQSGVGA